MLGSGTLGRYSSEQDWHGKDDAKEGKEMDDLESCKEALAKAKGMLEKLLDE